MILDNIVKVGNMLGELKGDVATKDDIAAVNERLEKLEHMLKSVANVLTSIGGWIQQADTRIANMDERLIDIERHLGTHDDALARIEGRLGTQP